MKSETDSRSALKSTGKILNTNKWVYNEQLLVIIPPEFLEPMSTDFQQELGFFLAHGGPDGNEPDRIEVGFNGGADARESSEGKEWELSTNSSYFAAVGQQLYGGGVFHFISREDDRKWVIPFDFEVKMSKDGSMICRTKWKGPFEVEVTENPSTLGGGHALCESQV